MTGILVPVLTMAALGFLFALGLVLADRKLRVESDPRVELIAEILPQANCGACGFPGCRAMAEAMVGGKTAPTGCPVGGEELARQVSGILGVQGGEFIKKFARVMCRGTRRASRPRGDYLGLQQCRAAHLLGGGIQCSFGCLGLGDCVRACPFQAMAMGEDGLPRVFEDKCTGCGLCVEACPRDIMELAPAARRVFVYCRSHDKGAVARRACDNACISCLVCSRACPEAIVLRDNLAVILDDSKIPEDKIPDIEKCPTGAIGRLGRPS